MVTKSKSGSAKSDQPTTKDELKVENVQSDGEVEETQTTPVGVNESGAGTTNGKPDEVDPLTSGAPTHGEDIKGNSTRDQEDPFAETKATAFENAKAEGQANGDEDEQDEAAADRTEGNDEGEVDGDLKVGEDGVAEDDAEDTDRVDTSDL